MMFKVTWLPKNLYLVHTLLKFLVVAMRHRSEILYARFFILLQPQQGLRVRERSGGIPSKRPTYKLLQTNLLPQSDPRLKWQSLAIDRRKERMDGGKKVTPMDQAAKARIMSANATKPGADGKIQPDTFPARAQSAADKNSNKQ